MADDKKTPWNTELHSFESMPPRFKEAFVALHELIADVAEEHGSYAPVMSAMITHIVHIADHCSQQQLTIDGLKQAIQQLESGAPALFKKTALN